MLGSERFLSVCSSRQTPTRDGTEKRTDIPWTYARDSRGLDPPAGIKESNVCVRAATGDRQRRIGGSADVLGQGQISCCCLHGVMSTGFGDNVYISTERPPSSQAAVATV
jgi:hypothetical protein